MNKISQLLKEIELAKGTEKQKLLLELCDYRCYEADEFFSKKLSVTNRAMLPYFCFSRSDAVSDFAADLLNSAVNKIIISGNQCSAEMSEELFTALNFAAFKQSDKLVDVLRKIGHYYDRIKRMTLDVRALMFGQSLLPYLRKTANAAWKNCCERNFIRLLNDLLICTAVRSDFEFADTIKALHREYPEAYSCAAFFVYFKEDNSGAFDRFGNISCLTAILNTMSGTYYNFEMQAYCQTTPIWFYGVKQSIYHKTLTLGRMLDTRWIDLLANRTNEALLGDYYGNRNPLTIYRLFDRLMIKLVNPHSGESSKILCGYFTRSAAYYGRVEAFQALNILGYTDYDKLLADICANICCEKNNYYSIYNAFALMELPRNKKLELLEITENYLRKNDFGEKLKNQREEFFREAELYRQNKKGRFKNKIAL